MSAQIIALLVGGVGLYLIRDELVWSLSAGLTFANAWFLLEPFNFGGAPWPKLF